MQASHSGELRRSIGIAWTLAFKMLDGRYARSEHGLVWLLLTPLATMMIYWGVFGLVLRVGDRLLSEPVALVLVGGGN